MRVITGVQKAAEVFGCAPEALEAIYEKGYREGFDAAMKAVQEKVDMAIDDVNSDEKRNR